jgi:cellulose synthase/poly-beta-1,6-N-acetylglucosamine synthase-like glycosyltransferase
MNRNSLLARLEKGFRALSVIALALMLFQTLGVLIYILTVWPGMETPPPPGITVLVLGAVTAALARSCLWVRIYWDGARVASALRVHGESTGLPGTLVPVLGRLTRLLAASCVLDVLLLPAIFLMDAFFPFSVTGVQLGLTLLATLLIPQAFGVAALLLAYLARQYGHIVEERCRMRKELELTV